MSERDDTQIALDILRLTAVVAPVAVEGVRRIIEAARPDLRLVDPPPPGRYAEIVAEDDAAIARRFGGTAALPTLAPSPRQPGEALGTPAAASVFRSPPDGFGPKGGDGA